MTTISQDRAVYRTILLPKAEAERFSRCLQANRQYQDVELVESSRATHPVNRWFVQYQPAAQDRQANLLAAHQKDRLSRAQQEAEEYVWVEDPDAHPGREFFHCQSVSGQVYEVDAHGKACSCPDFQIRCQRLGLRCKHLLAFDLRLGTLIRRENLPVIPRRRAA